MARWMLVVYLVVGYAFAQDPNATTADRVDLSTRASQIESARQQKAAALAPTSRKAWSMHWTYSRKMKFSSV
jgi:hypothetical protein